MFAYINKLCYNYIYLDFLSSEKNAMKNKWNIFIWIFLILVVANVVRGFFSEMVVTESVRQGNMEEAVMAKGVVVKYETLYTSEASGTAEAHVQEGERVGRGTSLVDVFSGDVDQTLISKLARINERIAVINENRLGNATFTNDAVKIESEISDCLDKIITLGNEKKFTEVANLKHRIAVLSDRKAVLEGTKESADNTLEQLKAEKSALEAQINSVRHRIVSNSSGVFSHYLDGFEEVITPYNMHEFTPNQLDDIIMRSQKEEKTKSNYICKVCDNFRYFICVPVDSEFASTMVEGKNAILRFPEISGIFFNAKIHAISEETDGRVSITFETNRHVESLILKRTANVEIIKSKYSGFKISLDALKTRGEENGVYAVREGSMWFIPVEILYNSDDMLIVKSKDAENPLKLYDEVILKADVYEEGKTVRN